jgi:hypothetical protein
MLRRSQRLAIDQVVKHHPTHCTRCGAALHQAVESACYHAHPVIDLRALVPERPALELMPIQHRYHERRCACGHVTRTEQGSRTVALLASVIETCRQRGHSPWAFIAETLTQRRRGLPVPVLPAAN